MKNQTTMYNLCEEIYMICCLSVISHGILGADSFLHSISRIIQVMLVLLVSFYYMSLCMKKPTICICENKDADQLRGNREADQRLCFRYTDSTISLLLKSEISSF